MLDRKKIADLRLSLVRADVRNQKGSSEEELSTEIRPLIGELLALADAALKIRAVYKDLESEGSPPWSAEVLAEHTCSAMRAFDELEGASHG